jgi:hypothetical protein
MLATLSWILPPSRPKKKKGDSPDKSQAERAYDRVKKWTKKVDLFSKKLVVIPICEE